MSPVDLSPQHAPTCFPRVSGDEPFADGFDGTAAMFSPRERG